MVDKPPTQPRLPWDCEHVWAPDKPYCLKCKLPARPFDEGRDPGDETPEKEKVKG